MNKGIKVVRQGNLENTEARVGYSSQNSLHTAFGNIILCIVKYIIGLTINRVEYSIELTH